MVLGENVIVIIWKVKNIDYNWIIVNWEVFKEDKLLFEINFLGDKIYEYFDLF